MNIPRPWLTGVLASTLFSGGLGSTPALAQQVNKTEPKPATAATAAANQAVAKGLSFNDKQDFEDATRGLIATLADPLVKGAEGKLVWDTQRFDFIKARHLPPSTPACGGRRS